MQFLSVCSGIEAASVAWDVLGWHPAAFSEIEPFPCAVLKHHYPGVPNLGDMTKFEEWDVDRIGPIDLLCGGTPCQAFSVAGLRKGLDDPRGNLMLVFGAIAAKFRPRWVVWENVPGVLSSNEGRDFGSFLALLGHIGYGFAYRILDAQYFGAAQRRRRVFVVGHLGDWRRAAAVLLERESLRGDSPPRRETGKDVAGTLSSRTQGGGGLGTDSECQGGLVPETTPTLDTTYAKAQGCSNQDMNTGFGLLVPQALGGNNTSGSIDVATAINASASGRMDFESETFIASDCKASGRNGFGVGMTVRRLTPTEAERLQGFPDGHTAIPWRGRPADQCPDGPRYRAIGNSWAVPCARWIGQRIQFVDGIAA